VNFFLRGAVCLCRGRGEQVEPIASRLTAAVLLVNPGFEISTRWAYQRWAQRPATLTAEPPAISVVRRAVASDDLAALAGGLYNSLEAASVTKFAVLQVLKETMRAQGAAGALMSGSGATVFGLFARAADAEACGQHIRREFGPGMWTQVARVGGGSQG
jgi:4-diphosphocytidyl-2-C-methyl-D-erythritol kinase